MRTVLARVDVQEGMENFKLQQQEHISRLSPSQVGSFPR